MEGKPVEPPMVFQPGHDGLQAVTWNHATWGNTNPPPMKNRSKVKERLTHNKSTESNARLNMKVSSENIRLAKEIHARLNRLTAPSTPMVRAIRKEFSAIADASPESVVQLALHLLDQNSDLLRFFS